MSTAATGRSVELEDDDDDDDDDDSDNANINMCSKTASKRSPMRQSAVWSVLADGSENDLWKRLVLSPVTTNTHKTNIHIMHGL